MKILFLEYNSYPIPDAVGNCAHKLRRELVRRGVACDVLTFRWDRAIAPVQQDALGTVYLADSFMHYARVDRDKNGRITGSFPYLLRAVIFKAFSFLLGGRYVREDKLPAAACRRMTNSLKRLCKENGYDWVIACGSPFCTLWTAAWAKLMQTKKLLYYFDPPYYAAPGFSEKPARVRRRLQKEVEAWQRADLVVIAPEHRAMAQNPAFDGVREKIMELTFPNLEIPREPLDEACPVAFPPDTISVTFVGTLYGGGREPLPLLTLFAEMVKCEPRLTLTIIGDKFGDAVGKQLAEFNNLLGERLRCLPAIPMRAGEAVLRRADVLVNIGNIDQSCLPSKVFDLISIGKPILQLCQVKNCNTLPFIERYPLSFICYADDCGSEATAARAAAFCRENAGKQADADALSAIYRGVTTRDIANALLTRMAAEGGGDA